MSKTQTLSRNLLQKSFWPCLYGIIILLFIQLTACTPSLLRTTDAPMYFAGRLSLVQYPEAHAIEEQVQSWSAHFELAGSPEEGSLLLYTPVGTTVAKVTWQPYQAIIETSEGIQYYESLDDVTSTYFQQSVPVAALFDWLKGEPTKQDIAGWDVDLSRSQRGIIKAERREPAPRVSLRAVVDERSDQSSAL